MIQKHWSNGPVPLTAKIVALSAAFLAATSHALRAQATMGTTSGALSVQAIDGAVGPRVRLGFTPTRSTGIPTLGVTAPDDPLSSPVRGSWLAQPDSVRYPHTHPVKGMLIGAVIGTAVGVIADKADHRSAQNGIAPYMMLTGAFVGLLAGLFIMTD